jgi:hypothetical protein
MNKRILTFAAVLAATLIAGVFATTPMAAYADGDYDGDSSETETEQEIKQKNVGSDASTNVNCGDNDINSASEIDAQVCGTAAIDLGALFG